MPEPEELKQDVYEGTLKEESREASAPAEKELFAWETVERPFKRRNKDFYVTVIAMASIIGFILFLTEGWIPVVLIISLVFLFYVMSTIEPGNVHYKISNFGIKVGDHLTLWEDMGRFWFTNRFESRLLVIETYVFPNRLELVVPAEMEEKIKSILAKYIKHEEIPASTIDKATNWFSTKLPGNR